MRVAIDHDRKGWYWFPDDTSREAPIPDRVKSKRERTYDAILSSAKEAGHEISNGGWKQKLLMWNWQSVALDGYPGWQLEHKHPAWCRLEHVNSNTAWPNSPPGEREGTKSSSDVTNAWDDVAEVQFYTRDISYDGYCSVTNGEAYGSVWWFRTAAERDRFLAWLPTFAPTVKIIYRSASELPEKDR